MVELKRLAKQVALHEAGHYIVGRVLGFEVGEIKIRIMFANGFAGGTEITLLQKLNTIKEIIRYLEKRIQVLYAGVLSQSLEVNVVNEDKANEYIQTTDGKDDFCKVRELLRILLNIKYSPSETDKEIEKQLAEINDDLWKRTIKHVEREQAHIKGLSGYLADKIKKFDEEEIVTVEEINDMPALNERFSS